MVLRRVARSPVKSWRTWTEPLVKAMIATRSLPVICVRMNVLAALNARSWSGTGIAVRSK